MGCKEQHFENDGKETGTVVDKISIGEAIDTILIGRGFRGSDDKSNHTRLKTLNLFNCGLTCEVLIPRLSVQTRPFHQDPPVEQFNGHLESELQEDE